MKNKFLICLALTTALFVSCDDQAEGGIEQKQNEITFMSGLNSPNTRLNEDGSQWTAGDRIGIYMLENGKTTVVNYANVLYKAESSAAVTAFKGGVGACYYPKESAPVDFMAYYPYSADVTDFTYPINLADQSSSLTAHDLMYATANNEGKGFTTEAVALQFSHQLSKLTLKFVDEKGENVTPKKVSITGTNTTANFDLKTATLSNEATAASIATFQSGNTAEAVVLPFAIAERHRVNFTIGEQAFVWNINDSYPKLGVKAGYVYTFKITVNATEGEVKGELVDFNGNSVTPWGTGSGSSEYTDLDLGLPAHENDGLVRAFPGAEGGGMFTTGGRGGKVVRVTNLNDSGTGSLRAALSQTGARTIVFDVDGVIELQSTLEIKNGDVTIAGQTAPGDGICLKNYSMVVKANNVIIRYIRSRMGDEKGTEDDAMWGRYIKNVIVDHCSMSWSTDECSSFYANENFTMQWCILAESLRNSVHDKGRHGYGAIWGGVNASFHHNLLAHHESRNPRFDGGDVYGTSDNPMVNSQRAVDYRNCVVYNYCNYPAYGGEGQSVNFVGNYYKWGPASINGTDAETNGKKRQYFYRISGVKEADHGCPSIFMEATSNFLDTNNAGSDNGINADNWAGLEYDTANKGATDYTKLTTPITIKPSGSSSMVTTHTAAKAFDKVLEFAGANLKRDAVDTRVTTETRNGTATYMDGGNGSLNGIIDTQKAVGGWPTYAQGEAKVDTDGDGMPDAWEDAFGLNKNSAADGNDKTLDSSKRYTNLEMYLHYLVKDIVKGQVVDGTYTTFN